MKRRTGDPVVIAFSFRVRNRLGDRLEAIRWFGSRSRGEGEGDSDYDLLLETRGFLSEYERDEIADIAVDISAEYGVLLDIHHRTVDQMHRPPFSYSPFIQTVMNEGVLV